MSTIFSPQLRRRKERLPERDLGSRAAQIGMMLIPGGEGEGAAAERVRTWVRTWWREQLSTNRHRPWSTNQHRRALVVRYETPVRWCRVTSSRMIRAFLPPVRPVRRRRGAGEQPEPTNRLPVRYPPARKVVAGSVDDTGLPPAAGSKQRPGSDEERSEQPGRRQTGPRALPAARADVPASSSSGAKATGSGRAAGVDSTGSAATVRSPPERRSLRASDRDNTNTQAAGTDKSGNHQSVLPHAARGRGACDRQSQRRLHSARGRPLTPRASDPVR